jgi:hypothetical protein
MEMLFSSVEGRASHQHLIIAIDANLDWSKKVQGHLWYSLI